MISKNEHSFTDDNAYSKYPITELINYYEKKVNHYIRNNLQIIISLIDMYAHLLERDHITIQQFEMLQSQIRSLISVYDLHKITGYIETVNLSDLFIWFMDYFEENRLFSSSRLLFTVSCPSEIPVPIQNSQHISLFIHELFVQLYILMEKHKVMSTKILITTINPDTITITIDLNTIPAGIEPIEFPVMSLDSKESQFKINSELFQLLLEQIKGHILVDSMKSTIEIIIPFSAIQQILPISWR